MRRDRAPLAAQSRHRGVLAQRACLAVLPISNIAAISRRNGSSSKRNQQRTNDRDAVYRRCEQTSEMVALDRKPKRTAWRSKATRAANLPLCRSRDSRKLCRLDLSPGEVHTCHSSLVHSKREQESAFCSSDDGMATIPTACIDQRTKAQLCLSQKYLHITRAHPIDPRLNRSTI